MATVAYRNLWRAARIAFQGTPSTPIRYPPTAVSQFELTLLLNLPR